jgi:hypothetical protein
MDSIRFLINKPNLYLNLLIEEFFNSIKLKK